MLTFDELKKQVEIDIEINEDNISEKSLKYSFIYHKYIEMYQRAVKELNMIKIEKDKIYGDLYHAYKFENKSGGYDLNTKTEIEVYVKRDEKYYKIALKYYNQESIVKYLEGVLQIINTMGFSIKNYIEIQKLRMGV
jgi:hypothetical protein